MSANMPKGKHGGGAAKRKERAVRAAYRKERKAGAYLSPGDPDFKSFSNQLAVQGLKLKDVPGDGNCLFRALSVQLGDRRTDHRQLRRDVVVYMREHKEEFEPFIDDLTSFDKYMSELSQDGEYAGNDAIVAFARCHSANVVIHQHNAPCWEVHAPSQGAPTLHIAYLNGEHYCSVEAMIPEDPLPSVRQGPPPVKVRGGSRAQPPSGRGVRGGISEEAQTVVEATGCEDLDLVEQSLCENSYDPELAIVEVFQLMSLVESGQPGGMERSLSSHKPQGRQPQSLQGESRKRQVQPVKSSSPQTQAGPRLSNKERKAEAKAARKQRRRETSSGKTHDPKEEPYCSMAI